MANTYGVDPDTLRQEYLPQMNAFSAASRPTSATVQRMIERVSSSIDAALLSAGVASADVTPDDCPVAYAWLADTLSLEAAARVAEIGSHGLQAAAVKAWHDEFKSRLEMLREKPLDVIPDAPLENDGAIVSSHITEDGLTNQREPSDDNTPVVAINDES
jgi:hypothetical protein